MTAARSICSRPSAQKPASLHRARSGSVIRAPSSRHPHHPHIRAVMARHDSRMRASTLWRLNWTLLLLHGTGAALAWSALPRRIPVHFDFGGDLDALAPASLASWFGLLAVSVAVSASLYVLSIHGPLELWNIPEKERFLRLTAQQRRPVLELLHSFMAGAAIGCTIVLAALQLGLYLVAHGYADRLPWYITSVMYGAIALLLVSTVPWSRTVRRAVLKAAGAERDSADDV